MLILKLYLFLGLVLHKVIWESLKHRVTDQQAATRSIRLLAIKAVKIAILVGVLVQIWLPEMLPLATDPLGLRIVGTLIYTSGLITAIVARIQLGENWANIETGQVLKDQSVVDNGIYEYVRHPIYVGDLLLLFGLELALNSWLVIGVVVLMPIVLLKAIKEERMLTRELPGYADYSQRSKRFIPFVY